MALIIAGTTNQFQQQKLFPITNSCKIIIVTTTEYSVYDVVSKQRQLHKLFVTDNSKKKFDYNSKFDIFRILGVFCLRLVREVINSNFDPEVVKQAEPYLCFMSKPVLPIAMQQVGIGLPYDVKYQGRPYKILNEGKLLDYGYDILFDLRELYFINKEKPTFILLNYVEKDIINPVTIEFFPTCVTGVSAVYPEKQVTYKYEDLWAVPKVQYCKWNTLRNFISGHIINA